MAEEISIERLRKVRKTRERVVAGLPEEEKRAAIFGEGVELPTEVDIKKKEIPKV